MHGSLNHVSGDLEAVGDCMNTYWDQKKKMAPGCEPQSVRRMMEALRPHTLGMSLAGAGGGGFLYVLTKEAKSVQLVRNVLTGVQVIKNCRLLNCHNGILLISLYISKRAAGLAILVDYNTLCICQDVCFVVVKTKIIITKRWSSVSCFPLFSVHTWPIWVCKCVERLILLW